MQQQFYREEPTARTSWRQAILMGVNTRTYKFALRAALLDLAKTGRDAVPLIELASTYATHLVNRTGNYPQASSSLQLSDKDFLSVLARERDDSVPTTPPPTLWSMRAARSIPGMVMDKFHNLPGEGEVAHRFYDIQGRGPNRMVRLTPDLQAVADNGTGLLDEELDSRWRIVEASFDAGIGRSLVREGVDVDLETGGLIARTRRVSLTSVRSAIPGFQHGRCFYCHQPLGDLGPDVHVDHVFPFWWMNTGSWRGPSLNGVWNLVLACAPCNLKKSGRLPMDEEITRLIARNDAIAESPIPLRRTLELSMGATGANASHRRLQFIHNVWTLVTTG